MSKETIQYTVKWFMKDKNLIAFNETKEPYTLSSKVAKFDHEKYGLKTGVKVDVGIVGKEVTYLRKSEAQDAPKDPVKESTKETPVIEIKTEPVLESADVKTHILTVSGITATKEVISFKEETGTKWYQVPLELREQFEQLGVKARATVEVTFGELEVKGGIKPSINTIKIVSTEKVEPVVSDNLEVTSEPINSSEKTYETYKVKNSTGTSIEHQVALKGAVDIIAALINKDIIKDLVSAKNATTELTQQFIKDIAG